MPVFFKKNQRKTCPTAGGSVKSASRVRLSADLRSI